MSAKNRILTAAFLLTWWLSLAATNTVQVTTNYVTAAHHFRKVDGQLYNTLLSKRWHDFSADVVTVHSNYVVIQAFETKAIYGPAERRPADRITSAGGYSSSTINPVVIPPYRPKIGEEKVLGKKAVLVNYDLRYLAVGQAITGRALWTGTTNSGKEVLELWDYGTPNVVAVLVTNSVKVISSPNALQEEALDTTPGR